MIETSGHDPLCPCSDTPPVSACLCPWIHRVRADEHGKSGDCMCPHPNVECQHPTCPRGIPDVRAAALRDAAAAVKAYADERLVVTEHPNMSEDITAALHIAAKRIEALGGER